MPPLLAESLRPDPLDAQDAQDAQDASYFAASDRIAKRWERDFFILRSYFVPESGAQEKA